MKKSTLLSLLTAGAVIATSAGTFAAWDQTSDSAVSTELTFRQKVSTEIASVGTFEQTAASKGLNDPVYEATSSITVSKLPSDASNYKVVVNAYAFKTKSDATEAKKDLAAVKAGTATNQLASSDVDVTVSGEKEKDASTTTETTLAPKITVTPAEKYGSTTADTTAAVLVVAELVEKPA